MISQQRSTQIFYPRLTTLLIVLCCSFILPPARGQTLPTSFTSLLPKQNLQPEHPPNSAAFSLAAVGDIIASEPFSAHPDANFSAVLKIISTADAGFGNLEDNLLDISQSKIYPEAENGGAWLIGPPQVAADLRAANFTLLARANNHSTEWTIAGMRATDRTLDAAGITHAGTGETRALARAAAFLQTPHARVALVSVASTFTSSSVASPALRDVPARPGMNALRTTEIHLVSSEMMEALAKIRDVQPYGPPAPISPNRAAPPHDLELFGVSYRIGENVGASTFTMNATDLAENLASIRVARQDSDYVLATIHTHEPDNRSAQPPDFLIEFAHQSIDAGADEFSAHGPHQLRGIEIYKGKPIFYSLGNFIFQVEKLSPVPYEMYEALQQDPLKVSDRQLNELFVKKFLDGEIWYQGLIATTHFANGQLTKIELQPVELGYHTSDPLRGLPRIPSPAVAQAILQRLQRISAPFHTKIEIRDNIGIIEIPSHN